jgi:FkbM family methyltransferase
MTNAPLIITGMHRSGTSLTASFFQKLGFSMGEQLYAADGNNQRGYFEDLDFLEFQRHILQECSDRHSPGWLDWGWTESESLDRARFSSYHTEAKKLIDSRQSLAAWGWKDPRTTLLLDFWQELLPQARYLLVYRYPWDVIDSILRLNAPIFTAHPDYALRIWHYYNQNLLDFYCKHQSQSILMSVNGFLGNCDRLLDLMTEKFGIDAFDNDKLAQKFAKDNTKQALADVYDPDLFGELDWEHPTVRGIQQIMPQSISLLQELDRHSDLASNLPINFDRDIHPIQPLLQLHYAQISGQKTANNEDKNTKYDRETIAIMEVVLQPDSCCVDVGCHTGEILKEILKLAPIGSHFAFEPLPSYYQGLLKQFSYLKNVIFSDFALSDSERETSFIFVESNPGFSGLQKRTYFRDNLESEEQTIELKVKTQLLDNLIPKTQTIRLIKIDVEGAEFEVLKGALQTIKRNQPVIVFEHGRGAADCYGTTPEMIYDLLANECDLSISTMERFLAHQTDFSHSEFCNQFNQGLNYYFIAYKHTAHHYLNQRKSLEGDLITQIQLLNDYRAIDREVISQLHDEIMAMKSSKFWKIREALFSLKDLLGIGQAEEQSKKKLD